MKIKKINSRVLNNCRPELGTYLEYLKIVDPNEGLIYIEYLTIGARTGTLYKIVTYKIGQIQKQLSLIHI